MSVCEIRLSDISTAGTQARVRLDEATVDAYREQMEAGVEFPPIVAFFDGTTYWLADGHHRKAALDQTARSEVTAEIYQGGQRDALLFALRANATHGLPRSRQDKRNAAEILLRDPEWSTRSDNWLAETAAVSHTFIAQMRKEIDLTSNVASSVRIGRDGKVRKRQATPNLARDPDTSSPAREEGHLPAVPAETDEPAPTLESRGLNSAPSATSLPKQLGVTESDILAAIDQAQASLKVLRDMAKRSKGVVVLNGGNTRQVFERDLLKRCDRAKDSLTSFRRDVLGQRKRRPLADRN